MDLRQQQHQPDEESVDQEREVSHPLHTQAMSSGYKVSVATILSRLLLNDMSQFQRLASSYDRLVAARTKLQPMGGQLGKEREQELEATQMDVAVGVQAQAIDTAETQAQSKGAAEARAQAIDTAETQAQVTGTAEARTQAMVSTAEAPPQGIEGDQRDTQASPFSPFCRWP